jgi:outer membrane protein assembly factor BamD (BamD/ComL family)
MDDAGRYYVLIAMIVFAITFSACAGDNAKELLETAKFEELQNNRGHATELYEEIIKKHPKSEYAKKAEERLMELKRDTTTKP